VRHKGFLDGFDLSRTDVENMIMAARVQAGWITQEDLEKPEAEAEDSESEPAGDAASAPG
jgi:N utilization substance protein A